MLFYKVRFTKHKKATPKAVSQTRLPLALPLPHFDSPKKDRPPLKVDREKEEEEKKLPRASGAAAVLIYRKIIK